MTIPKKKILVIGGLLKKDTDLSLLVYKKQRAGYHDELEFTINASRPSEAIVTLFEFSIPVHSKEEVKITISLSDFLNLGEDFVLLKTFAQLLEKVTIDLRINRTYSVQFGTGFKRRFTGVIGDDIDLKPLITKPQH